MRYSGLIVTAVVLAALAGGVAFAGGMMGGNHGGMMGQGGMHQGNGQMQRQNQNQSQSGTTPAMPGNMRMRGRMMYNLQANPEAPASVLALQKQLQLTPQQVQKIQQIAQQARRQTQQVLTAKQQQALKQLKGTPNTFMGMHNQMLQWMMQHHRQMTGRSGQMMGGRGMMHGRGGMMGGGRGMMNGGMMGRGGMMGQGMRGSPWMNMMQWQFGSPKAQSNVPSKEATTKQPNKTFTLSTGWKHNGFAFIGADQATKGQVNPTLHVKQGDLVKIVLKDGDGVVHDIVIPAFHASSANVTSKGSQADLVFRADRAGTFTYYCSIPGHRALGMQGKLVVSK